MSDKWGFVRPFPGPHSAENYVKNLTRDKSECHPPKGVYQMELFAL